MGRAVWLIEPGPRLTAEVNGLRLMVWASSDGTARFLVLQPLPGCVAGGELRVALTSGHRAGVRQAMDAAEWALARHR